MSLISIIIADYNNYGCLTYPEKREDDHRGNHMQSVTDDDVRQSTSQEPPPKYENVDPQRRTSTNPENTLINSSSSNLIF